VKVDEMRQKPCPFTIRSSVFFVTNTATNLQTGRAMHCSAHFLLFENMIDVASPGACFKCHRPTLPSLAARFMSANNLLHACSSSFTPNFLHCIYQTTDISPISMWRAAGIWDRRWPFFTLIPIVFIFSFPSHTCGYHSPQISLSLRRHVMQRPCHALQQRRHALRHALTVSLGVCLGANLTSRPLPSARAADRSGGRKGLVNILRIRAFIVTLKETLKELVDKGATSAPAEVNQQIKYLVRTVRMPESINDAAMLIESSRDREAARGVGRSGYEYLTQVIEFSGFEDMKREGVSKYATLSSPERIEFALKCLTAAEQGAHLAGITTWFHVAYNAVDEGLINTFSFSLLPHRARTILPLLPTRSDRRCSGYL